MHHLHYRSLGREAPTDLLVVCRDCHQLVDEARQGSWEYEEWFKEAFPYNAFTVEIQSVLREYIQHLLDWGEHPHSEKPDAWWAAREDYVPS